MFVNTSKKNEKAVDDLLFAAASRYRTYKKFYIEN